MPSSSVPLRDRLQRAFARRDALLARGHTDAVRLCHGAADDLDGVVIEKLGPVLIVQVHEGRCHVPLENLKQELAARMPSLMADSAYLKHFVRDRAAADDEIRRKMSDATPWIGRPGPEEFPVNEYNRRFLVRPYDGFSTGLFLEHRENRRRIAELARDRSVLNLFAYTCSFSVAAARGGASAVDSVDLSKRYLEWGKRNFLVNDLPLEPHRFFCSDTFDYFDRARRQGRHYDLIVLDPPTFSRQRRPSRVFTLADALPRLLTGVLSLLNPGGMLLLSVNERGMKISRLVSMIRNVDRPHNCNILSTPELPPDFSGDPDYSKAVLVRVD